MSATPMLDQAIATTRTVLAGVKADQLDDPTPCASWKVRDLINHIVGGQEFFRLHASGGEASGEEVDYASGDFVSAFDANADKTVAAFGEEGVLQKTLTLPFGQMPGFAFAALAATDTFQHGWDLAKATGQDTNLDPELAAQLLAGAKMSISDAFRGDEPMPFSAEKQAPEGASAADQLAAFLGRDVA